MSTFGTYFISRLIKVGEIYQKDIVEALSDPKTITSRSASYTITNFEKRSFENIAFYYGKLTKFRDKGLVKVIDRVTNREIDQLEPDLIIASSPFIFIPEYSSFIYLRVWNQIDPTTFSLRMREIILASKDYFLVDCELQPVSDIKTFLERVKKISIIHEIRAKVNPPNPLFGHLWKSLDRYLSDRNLEELKIAEKSSGGAIQTNLIDLLQQIDDNSDLSKIDSKSIPIGDAAILMSIDGYGSGSIEGQMNQRYVTIRTNQKSVHFKFPLDGRIDDLFIEAKRILDNINSQRYLNHDD